MGCPTKLLETFIFRFPGHDELYNYYERELNIEKAMATTRYDIDGVTYTREVFASLPDQVIIVRITANKPAQLFCTAFDGQAIAKRNFNRRK
jgi:alpha-L-fucosidase 2